MSEGYSTPEEAARGDIPARYSTVLDLAYSPDAKHAVVLLGTNEPPYVYEYEVVCSMENDHWVGGSGGNGPAGRRLPDDRWVETDWLPTDDGYRLAAEWMDDAPDYW